jgi:hypothetical protein
MGHDAPYVQLDLLRDNCRQFRSLRTEYVENKCKCMNILMKTISKRQSCIRYVWELVNKIKVKENNYEDYQDKEMVPSFSVNSMYKKLSRNRNQIHSNFVKQTIDFETTMYNLNYQSCKICQQMRLCL